MSATSSQFDAMMTMKSGLELFRQTRFDAALDTFLQCWDCNMPEFSAVKVSFLIGYLGELSRVHPPAVDAMRQRLDELRKLVQAKAASHADQRCIQVIELEFPSLAATDRC
jgi:hypothetical protein